MKTNSPKIKEVDRSYVASGDLQLLTLGSRWEETCLEESKRKPRETEVTIRPHTAGSYQCRLLKHPENEKNHQQLSKVHKDSNRVPIPCSKPTLWPEITKLCNET